MPSKHMYTTSLFKPEASAIRAPLQLRNVEIPILAMTHKGNAPDTDNATLQLCANHWAKLVRAGVLVRLANVIGLTVETPHGGTRNATIKTQKALDDE